MALSLRAEQKSITNLFNSGETTDNILLSLILSIFIAVIVLCISMFVGSVLHKGVLIEKIAFGK